MYEGEQYVMYYDNQATIGRATSSDGVNWVKHAANPIVSAGAQAGWGQPVIKVEEPSATVVLDGLELIFGAGLRAGGVEAQAANLTIRNCLIHHNRSGGKPGSWAAGGVWNNGGLLIANSLIVYNEVQAGAGGVYTAGGSLRIENTLLARNTGDYALRAAGAAYLSHATLTYNTRGVLFEASSPSILFQVYNSVIFDNNGAALEQQGAGTLQAAYSDLEGGYPGQGNLDINPHYVEAEADDFRLAGSSPLIDRGSPPYSTPTDLEGRLRLRQPDLGAYEFAGARLYLPLTAR
jgi:hypothetical protein